MAIFSHVFNSHVGSSIIWPIFQPHSKIHPLASNTIVGLRICSFPFCNIAMHAEAARVYMYVILTLFALRTGSFVNCHSSQACMAVP